MTLQPNVHEDAVSLLDCEPSVDDLAADAVDHLDRRPRQLPCKLLYDQRGSRLFDRICELDEYYPTRTETRILRENAREMAGQLGPGVLLVEYGSGSSIKTRILLNHLVRPAGYVPIDISREHLLRSARALAAAYRHVPILPVCADYHQPLELPEPPTPARRPVAFFPGSTIGNFQRDEARAFLRRIADLLGPGGLLLIGVDLRKDPAILLRAYDDAEGVTAEFNRNLLVHLNREAGADFDVDAFEHRAVWNEPAGRIEMWLIARTDQSVHLAGRSYDIPAGEGIRTECSHKYTPADFAALADGYDVLRIWRDPDELFSVQLLRVRPDRSG